MEYIVWIYAGQDNTPRNIEKRYIKRELSYKYMNSNLKLQF